MSNLSQPTPSQCSVFVIAFIDSSSVQTGQSSGLYFVDNRGNNGSSNEASALLTTSCQQMDMICWSVYSLNPNDGLLWSIQSIGSSNAWGAGGQPNAGKGNTFTGQAQKAASSGYTIELTGQGSGTAVQPLTTLNMNVR